MKIILAGFNGTWRKEIGIILSERLGRKFFDVEQIIEERERDRFIHIVQIKGIDYIRKLQNQIVNEIVSNDECIISITPDILSGKKNRERFKSNGLIIWLTAELSIILLRLYPGKESKDLLRKKDALTHIRQMLKEQDFSNFADRIIDTSSLTPEEATDTIQKMLTVL